ncbi:MAG TPA: hypothetical protein VHN39_11675 [Phenylobacterium sp.]|jgi:hypothetical protein|nr:hypothetical protein [Phenylobacterium sp.]
MGDPLDDRLRVVQALVKLFSFERYVYLATNGFSVLMLLLAAARLLITQKPDTAVLLALFGSTGLITFSLGRVLRMWDQAVRVLIGAKTDP